MNTVQPRAILGSLVGQ